MVGVSTSKVSFENIAAMKISINLQKMAIPKRLDNYSCYLVILCTYVETQKPYANKTSQGSGHFSSVIM